MDFQAAWEMITGAGLLIDEPQPFGQCLGCGQRTINISQEEVGERLTHITSPFSTGALVE